LPLDTRIPGRIGCARYRLAGESCEAQSYGMTVGELLEELQGVDQNIEIAIATERPKGSWSIDSVSLAEDEGSPTVFLHCDVPRY